MMKVALRQRSPAVPARLPVEIHHRKPGLDTLDRRPVQIEAKKFRLSVVIGSRATVAAAPKLISQEST